MINHFDKISTYSRELYKKLNKDYYQIPEERTIQIGDNLIIDGIYLNVEGCGNFCDIYLEVADSHATMSMDILSDAILGQIAHILRMEINNN